jgi:hypothetical protein
VIWNIIDERNRRYRWAKVHAIVEATWHDNSVSGADQAPPTTAETEVTFDEREDISVHDAVNWANSQTCPVTLYLSDGDVVEHSSSREVDAAARILDAFGRNNGWWPRETPPFDDLDPVKKADFEFVVQGMLRAAAKVRA